MTIPHLILRYAHISMGLVGLLSGALAMTARKGSTLHRRSGNLFLVSMLVMSATGAIIAAVITPSKGNVMGGTLAFYLVCTAWLTVARAPQVTGRVEIAAALLGLAVAAAGAGFGMQALASPTGLNDGYPATLYFVFGSVAALGAMLDVLVIRRGGLAGTARTTRHLWRMCLAMFIATSSFFLGQAQLFPVAVRKSGLLPLPTVLVLGALVFWLVRVRIWPAIRRVRSLGQERARAA